MDVSGIDYLGIDRVLRHGNGIQGCTGVFAEGDKGAWERGKKDAGTDG